MTDRRDVFTWREVVVTIVVLEGLLLLCRWLVAPHAAVTPHRDTAVLVDMLVLAGLVLFVARALQWRWPTADLKTVRSSLFTFVMPLTSLFATLGMLFGTVIGGWFAGVVLAGCLAGVISAFLTLLAFAAVYGGRRTPID